MLVFQDKMCQANQAPQLEILAMVAALSLSIGMPYILLDGRNPANQLIGI